MAEASPVTKGIIGAAVGAAALAGALLVYEFFSYKGKQKKQTKLKRGKSKRKTGVKAKSDRNSEPELEEAEFADLMGGTFDTLSTKDEPGPEEEKAFQIALRAHPDHYSPNTRFLAARFMFFYNLARIMLAVQSRDPASVQKYQRESASLSEKVYNMLDMDADALEGQSASEALQMQLETAMQAMDLQRLIKVVDKAELQSAANPSDDAAMLVPVKGAFLLGRFDSYVAAAARIFTPKAYEELHKQALSLPDVHTDHGVLVDIIKNRLPADWKAPAESKLQSSKWAISHMKLRLVEFEHPESEEAAQKTKEEVNSTADVWKPVEGGGSKLVVIGCYAHMPAISPSKLPVFGFMSHNHLVLAGYTDNASSSMRMTVPAAMLRESYSLKRTDETDEDGNEVWAGTYSMSQGLAQGGKRTSCVFEISIKMKRTGNYTTADMPNMPQLGEEEEEDDGGY